MPSLRHLAQQQEATQKILDLELRLQEVRYDALLAAQNIALVQAQATQNNIDAQQKAVEAQQALVSLREENLRAIHDAIENVARARENLAEVQYENSLAIRNAERALAESHERSGRAGRGRKKGYRECLAGPCVCQLRP